MRTVLDDVQRTVSDCLVRSGAADFQRHDLVAIAVNDQGGNIYFGQVRAKICS